MPNFAGALKGEMRRLARKEVRATVTPLRKVVAALRRRVAQQKRLIAELERSTKRSMRNGRAAEAPETQDSQIRFSPQWVKKHRKKLNMSRRVYAKLVGVSAQTIFGWETGRARPRRGALETWRRIRSMGKRELKGMTKAEPNGRRGRAAKRGLKAGRKAKRGRAVVRKRGRATARRRGRPAAARRRRAGARAGSRRRTGMRRAAKKK